MMRSSAPHSPTTSPEPVGAERRQSGQRARARDRLMDRTHGRNLPSRALSKVRDIENMLLFVDDDLRETALAITHIESYLSRMLSMLESSELRREQLHAAATEPDVLEHLDLLNETLESLRRRLAKLATTMR